MSTIVKLTKPVVLFDKTIGQIELKEPGGGLYLKLGEPRLTVFNASGSGYYAEQNEAIIAYLNKLIVHEHGGEVIYSLLCLEDAKAVKAALFEFFQEAEARLAARRSTPSSSA